MKRSSRVEAEATDWLARRDRDDWSSSQQESLDAWLNDATENRIAYLRMERTWSRADRLVTMKRPGQMSVPPQKGFWGSSNGAASGCQRDAGQLSGHAG
ncbi:FecR/PupR family sigma factor regulator, partial [Herbaspirillum sp. B65]|uniref:FecR/PupR family sigma factor regulator n=1 Tax=Herbaspirillum sp. B65 TaxID=137708 RepID=UPI0011D1D54C